MDKFWENYIKTRPADSKGAFDAFRKMSQEPRNMELAKADIPRHLWTNMNIPDLEQSPDSFLQPGETLEDWDVSFRRPNAEGGRIGFAKAKLVGKNQFTGNNPLNIQQSTYDLIPGSKEEIEKLSRTIYQG